MSCGIPACLASLMVSYTVAGLEEALVITEAYLPLMEKLGLKSVADFRGKFRGKSDLEIFQWAYDQYWPRCSRDYLVYLGEYCTGLKGGPGRRPAVADFAIVKKAFCTDLSAMPADTGEYRLANRIMSEMHPYAYVYGWHSYCKDKEEEHITMLSRHALIMAEGLATLPNMSFHGQVPVSSRFQIQAEGDVQSQPGGQRQGLYHADSERRHGDRFLVQARARRNPVRMGGERGIVRDRAGASPVLLRDRHAE